MKFDPKAIFDSLPKGAFKYHRSFPSLHFIKDVSSRMEKYSRREATFYKCCLNVAPKYDEKNEESLEKMLGRYCYFDYPFLNSCYLIAIITPERLLSKLENFELPFDYNYKKHKEFYIDEILNLNDTYFEKYGIVFNKKSDFTLGVVEYCKEARKDSQGALFCPNCPWTVIPLELIFETATIPAYRGVPDFKKTRLEEEFPRGTEVILKSGQNVGTLGVVRGYNDGHDYKNVRVQIMKPVIPLKVMTAKIAKKYDSHQHYVSGQQVAKQLGTTVPVLLTILDSVIVKTDPYDNEQNIYPEKFDIGLGLIHRKSGCIVPELVICHELNNRNKKNSFPEFQLAPEAVELVKDYYENFKVIFHEIKNQFEYGDFEVLRAEKIYTCSKNPNLEIFKIFIWILKHGTSSLAQSNKSSKVIPREGIKELEKILDENRNLLFAEKDKQIIGKEFDYNPNFISERNDDVWIPPLFYKRPPWHEIGDRVVNLKTTSTSVAPFGASGTIVGILGMKREESGSAFEMKVEVLFDRPFIGGTNLNGRCKWGRGAVVDFDDVYNLIRWPDFVRSRERRRDGYFAGWDGKQAYYVPQFQVTETQDDSGFEKGPESKEGGLKSNVSAPVQARNTQNQIPLMVQKKEPLRQDWVENTGPKMKSRTGKKEDNKETFSTSITQGIKIVEEKVIDVKQLEGSGSNQNQTITSSVQEFFAKTIVSSGPETSSLSQNSTNTSVPQSEESKGDLNNKSKHHKLQPKSKEFVIVQKSAAPLNDPAIIAQSTSVQQIINDPAIIAQFTSTVQQNVTQTVDVSQLQSILKVGEPSSEKSEPKQESSSNN